MNSYQFVERVSQSLLKFLSWANPFTLPYKSFMVVSHHLKTIFAETYCHIFYSIFLERLWIGYPVKSQLLLAEANYLVRSVSQVLINP